MLKVYLASCGTLSNSAHIHATPDGVRAAGERGLVPRRSGFVLAGLLVAIGHDVAPAEPPPAAFTLRILSPSPLYLEGRCRVEAGAMDAAGQPYTAIAWMSLSIDGGEPVLDAQPPFAWDLDLPEGAARHTLELSAVARDGGKAALRALSEAQRFVERVGVNTVLVPVVVRDASGAVRTGLRQEDFSILEDGSLQPITSFTTEAVPASVLLALDTSASMERHLWSAQRALTDFVATLPPGTALSLISFNDQVYLERPFTPDRKEIETGVAVLRTEGTRTALYDAVRIGSAHLAKRAGTRVMVLFSDGEDTVYEGQPGQLRTTIDAAQGTDVSLYALAYGGAVGSDPNAPLSQLAAETGGEVAPARGPGQLREAFARIGSSLGSRYLLG